MLCFDKAFERESSSTLTIAALRGKVLKEKVLILSERFLAFSGFSRWSLPEYRLGQESPVLSNRWQMAREKELRQPDRVQIPENTPVSF